MIEILNGDVTAEGDVLMGKEAINSCNEGPLYKGRTTFFRFELELELKLDLDLKSGVEDE